MNRISTLLLFICCISSLNSFSQRDVTDSLLAVLKSDIKKEQVYDERKEAQIQQLKDRPVDTGPRQGLEAFAKDSLIFEQYRSYKYDSAFVYANRMIRTAKANHNKAQLVQGSIVLTNILINSRMYKEAFDQLAKIDTNGMAPALKSDFLIMRARLTSGIADYDNDAVYAKMYRERANADFKRAEKASAPNPFEQTINLAFDTDAVKRKGLNADYFFDFLIHKNLNEHNLAMASTRLSFAFTGIDKIRFLTLAAINDIRSSTKETMAILLLGEELFKLGNSKDAYLAIQSAVSDAKFYGARGHQVQIESILPIIASKLLDEKQHERDRFLIGFLIFLIIAVLLFFILFIYRKQLLRIKAHERLISEKNIKLEDMNGKLWESSRIKEEFIGLFFKSCSSYIEILEKLKHKIQHSIKLANYQQANQVLNTVQVERERNKLYEKLDNMILTLFPNFVSSFNQLLREEEQVWPKAGETLNASLRIFALTRLGINEVEAIAKILNYSVSTVYTYKMRIKSKALMPAEEFEKKVMEIKFTEDRSDS